MDSQAESKRYNDHMRTCKSILNKMKLLLNFTELPDNIDSYTKKRKSHEELNSITENLLELRYITNIDSLEEKEINENNEINTEIQNATQNITFNLFTIDTDKKIDIPEKENKITNKTNWELDALPYNVSFMSLPIPVNELDEVESKVNKICDNSDHTYEDKYKILRSVFFKENVNNLNIENISICFAPICWTRNLNCNKKYSDNYKPNVPKKKKTFGPTTFIAMPANISSRKYYNYDDDNDDEDSDDEDSDDEDSDDEDSETSYKDASVNTNQMKYRNLNCSDYKPHCGHNANIDSPDFVKFEAHQKFTIKRSIQRISQTKQMIKDITRSSIDKMFQKQKKLTYNCPYEPSVSSLPLDSEKSETIVKRKQYRPKHKEIQKTVIIKNGEKCKVNDICNIESCEEMKRSIISDVSNEDYDEEKFDSGNRVRRKEKQTKPVIIDCYKKRMQEKDENKTQNNKKTGHIKQTEANTTNYWRCRNINKEDDENNKKTGDIRQTESNTTNNYWGRRNKNEVEDKNIKKTEEEETESNTTNYWECRNKNKDINQNQRQDEKSTSTGICGNRIKSEQKSNTSIRTEDTSVVRDTENKSATVCPHLKELFKEICIKGTCIVKDDNNLKKDENKPKTRECCKNKNKDTNQNQRQDEKSTCKGTCGNRKKSEQNSNTSIRTEDTCVVQDTKNKSATVCPHVKELFKETCIKGTCNNLKEDENKTKTNLGRRNQNKDTNQNQREDEKSSCKGTCDNRKKSEQKSNTSIRTEDSTCVVQDTDNKNATVCPHVKELFKETCIKGTCVVKDDNNLKEDENKTNTCMGCRNKNKDTNQNQRQDEKSTSKDICGNRKKSEQKSNTSIRYEDSTCIVQDTENKNATVCPHVKELFKETCIKGTCVVKDDKKLKEDENKPKRRGCCRKRKKSEQKSNTSIRTEDTCVVQDTENKSATVCPHVKELFKETCIKGTCNNLKEEYSSTSKDICGNRKKSEQKSNTSIRYEDSTCIVQDTENKNATVCPHVKELFKETCIKGTCVASATEVPLNVCPHLKELFKETCIKGTCVVKDDNKLKEDENKPKRRGCCRNKNKDTNQNQRQDEKSTSKGVCCKRKKSEQQKANNSMRTKDTAADVSSNVCPHVKELFKEMCIKGTCVEKDDDNLKDDKEDTNKYNASITNEVKMKNIGVNTDPLETAQDKDISSSELYICPHVKQLLKEGCLKGTCVVKDDDNLKEDEEDISSSEKEFKMTDMHAWALAYVKLEDDGAKLVQILHTSPYEPGRYFVKNSNEVILLGPAVSDTKKK